MQTSGNEKKNETKETNSEKHASETHFITCYTSIITIWCKEMIVIGHKKKEMDVGTNRNDRNIVKTNIQT